MTLLVYAAFSNESEETSVIICVVIGYGDGPRLHAVPDFMNLRIRSKFIGILVIAAALPLTLAITVIEIVGHQEFERTKGLALKAEAERIARELGAELGAHAIRLQQWTEFVNLGAEYIKTQERLFGKGRFYYMAPYPEVSPGATRVDKDRIQVDFARGVVRQLWGCSLPVP